MESKKKLKPSQPEKAKMLSVFPVPFILAFVFDCIYGFFYYRCFKATSFYDTTSYFTAASNLEKGKLDLLRTPVYPLLLRTLEHIDKKHATTICVGIQIVVFYISIFFFFKLLEMFTSNRVMQAAGTVIYGCMSSVITYNFYVLTESFAISGTVIFCYLIVRYVRKDKPLCLAGCIVLTLFLAMLRPSMVFLYVVVAVAVVPLIVRMFRKKKFGLNLVPIFALVLCIAALIGYMMKNKKDNNYFGLSYVSDMNRFYDVVQADIWRDNSNVLIVSDLYTRIEEENTAPLGAAIAAEEANRDLLNDPMRIADFNKEAISKHKTEYLQFLLKKTIRMGAFRTEYNLTHDSYYFKDEDSKKYVWFGDIFDFNVNFSYLVLLITWVAAITVLIQKKKLMAGEFLISLVIAGQIAINILSGPAEFHRLNVICYPLTVLLTFACVGLALDSAGNTISRQTHEVRFRGQKKRLS